MQHVRRIIGVSVLLIVSAVLLISSYNSVEHSVEKKLQVSDGKIRKTLETNDTLRDAPQYKLWHYQLQGANFEDLLKLDVNFVVIDPDDADLDKNQISSLKSNGKTILAYLSIGEAENYRDYWRENWKSGNPDFIAEENPEWPGNYKVKYWAPEWQRITLDRVRKIAKLGYDGAYLDILDAYEYWEERGVPDAAEQMVTFVRKIAEEARRINPRFLIVPQNAPELYQFHEYRETINGLGKEDTWFVGNSLQDPEETNRVLYYLDWAVRNGKFVLAIDYPTEMDKICEFYEHCSQHHLYCAVSSRELNRSEPITCED